MTVEPWKAKGQCSVPMWLGGIPAGRCGKTAFGVHIEGETFRNAWTGEVRRRDGKWNGLSHGLCCPDHGGPKETGPRVFEDGHDENGRRMWCAVMHDFENLQESPAAFHVDAWRAVQELERVVKEACK